MSGDSSKSRTEGDDGVDDERSNPFSKKPKAMEVAVAVWMSPDAGSESAEYAGCLTDLDQVAVWVPDICADLTSMVLRLS